MTDYAKSTVVQLKEQLQARGLSLDGLKGDLVKRLQESDAASASIPTPAPTRAAPISALVDPTPAEPVAPAPVAPVAAPAEPVAPVAAEPVAPAATEPVATEPVVAAPPTTEPIVAAPSTTEPIDTAPATTEPVVTIDTPAPVPEPKPELTKEEIAKMALDLLSKKIHRAKKFGLEQADIDDLERSVARIEKFGLDLTSPLAVELGLVKKPLQLHKNASGKKGARISKGGNRNNRNHHNNNGRRWRY